MPHLHSRWFQLCLTIGWVGIGIQPVHAHEKEVSRPNIILVMLDDMGWSDLGCFGGEVRTPNIDRLASKGLRFSSFYNTGRCCPTRASLLTGRYPHQVGLGRMTFDAGLPGYRGQLDPEIPTIAELLNDAGYQTAMLGKWHLSLTKERDQHLLELNHQQPRLSFADLDSYPIHRGFDQFYGIIWGVVDYFDPFSLVEGTEAVLDVPEDYYITEALNDRTVETIHQLAQNHKPFFLYVAHCAPHWPLHALPVDIARYRKTYQVGWNAVREARYRCQLELGILDSNSTTLSPAFGTGRPSWTENPDAQWDGAAMACHAAMIDRVDQGIGRMIQALEERNLDQNTLILLLSDNGASREVPSRPGFDRNSETRDGHPVIYYGNGKPKEQLPGPETTYAGIGPRWANVANTPFRLFKATMYEGGIRTPLIAHWPQGIQLPEGTITEAPGHVIDIVPTCLDLAGVAVSGTRVDQEESLEGIEGQSLVPIFQEGNRPGHDAIYFEHFGNKAIRIGEWKLVARPEGDWELYNLSKDQAETNDVSAAHPDRVVAMADCWKIWASRAQVYPMP